MNSDDEDINIEPYNTPPKKLKRVPKFFSDDWLKCIEFKGWLQKVPNNGHKAHCKACKVRYDYYNSYLNNISPIKYLNNL